MILKRTFDCLASRLSLAVLVQLLFVISSFNISPSAAQCANKCLTNSTCVRRAQTCLAMSCGLYPEFYKAPNIKFGTSEKENPFTETHTIGIVNSMRTMTIKSLNSTDSGLGIYYSIDEEKDKPTRCFFNVFVYDPDTYDGSITVENETASIRVNKSFGVIVKSFGEKVFFNFSYEALPLNSLIFNNQAIPANQATTCSPTNPWLSCLQSPNLEVKIERCKNRYDIKLDYAYDFYDEFTSVLGVPLNRVHNHAIELLYPPQMKEDTVELEFTNISQTFKLNCGVECANPGILTYSWVRASDPDTVLFSGADYEFTVQTLISEPLMNDDVIEVVCKSTNTINQNDAPSSAGSRTVFKLKYFNQTEELTTSTEEMNTTVTESTTTTETLDLPKAPKGLSGGAIAGIVVGSIAALILIVAVVLLLARRGSRSSKQESSAVPQPRRVDTGTPMNRRNVSAQQFNSDLTPNPLYNMNISAPAAAPSSSNQQNRQRSQNLTESVISKEGIYYF